MSARTLQTFALALLAPAVWLTACGDEGAKDADAEWLDEYGVEGPFEPGLGAGKEDGPGRAGPKASWDTGQSRVWEVEHGWGDVTPEVGLAWDADSGLDWNEKFAAWLESLQVIDADVGWGKTFEIINPQGKTLPGPVLECAEVAIFLRATFAAWYGLPFYLEAWDSGQALYLGHFGFLRGDGSRFGRSPSFTSRYTDYTDEWRQGQSWPSDAKLRKRGLYGGGDEMPFLEDVAGQPAKAGAYFDEFFLNKRVGHFMMLVLSWFGSVHLADGANMFHIKADAVRAGDVLLERWQRRGIGHTIPVMRVEDIGGGRLEIAVATGSMPRRQPKWEEGADVRHYFTIEETGGEGENGDGDRFAALGGGIRRWRVAVASGGRYRNTFLPEDEASWINSTDLDAIAARPERFRELMQELSGEEKRDLAIRQVADARRHLSDYPASCSARTRREKAFAELYEVMQSEFSKAPAAVDAEYRELADYVFAELVYDKSRTCCWNSSTHAMYELAMAYNNKLLEEAKAQGRCEPPVVFMARGAGADSDGYDLFRGFAKSVGQGDAWVTWSRDESCPWESHGGDDTEAEHAWTAWCELPAEGEGGEGGEGGDDRCGDTGDWEDGAVPLELGTYEGLQVCEGETDTWSHTGAGGLMVTVQLAEDAGDLDLRVRDAAGEQLGQSITADATEQVKVDLGEGATVFIEVYGYDEAIGGYTLVLAATE